MSFDFKLNLRAANKLVKHGSDITCICCGKSSKKQTNNKQFCCDTCKDKFWNSYKSAEMKGELDNF